MRGISAARRMLGKTVRMARSLLLNSSIKRSITQRDGLTKRFKYTVKPANNAAAPMLGRKPLLLKTVCESGMVCMSVET